ncbi:hypothetical protein AA103587_1745 [Gluconobacter kanchanaburiensis NBRC 103587]|nr:hypothetical protein AA103587_1745 [Gluconobacter kanchanaburiensis NBRC 103587]
MRKDGAGKGDGERQTVPVVSLQGCQSELDIKHPALKGPEDAGAIAIVRRRLQNSGQNVPKRGKMLEIGSDTGKKRPIGFDDLILIQNGQTFT